jgi:hypothetical protein
MRRPDLLKKAAALWCGRRDGSSGALPSPRGPALAGLTSGTRTEGYWNTTAATGHKRTLVRLRQQAAKLQG